MRWRAADSPGVELRTGRRARVRRPGVVLGPDHTTGTVQAWERTAVTIEQDGGRFRYARCDVEVLVEG